MNQVELKNKIQGLCNKAIDEAETKQEQKELVANLLRVAEFDDEQDNKRDNAVRRVKRAWFVKGKNPHRHDTEMFNLHKNWKTLHDAVEALVS